MSAGFTPGPWSIETQELSEGQATCVYGSRGMRLADWLSEPDAHLIAAAPELFEALELADATLRGANMNRNVVERKVAAALAKARGQ